MPFGFLGIKGHIATGEGIQGLFASRNAVSVICVIALVTFFIEWKTRSVSASIATGSLIGAALCLWLAASPVGFVTAVVVAAGYGILYALRKLPDSSRRGVNIGLLGMGLVSIVAAWAFRGAVIQFLSSSPVMQYRLTLWIELGRIAQMKFLEGWGWVGIWPKKTQPFTVMVNANTTPNSSGLNIYLDVWLQLGLIGLVLFLILLGFAFVRSWRSATTKKSDVYLWSPLILIALLVSGLAESSALTLWGWLLVVIIAAQNSPEKLTRTNKKEAVTA
jgi:O-antigen ligase